MKEHGNRGSMWRLVLVCLLPLLVPGCLPQASARSENLYDLYFARAEPNEAAAPHTYPLRGDPDFSTDEMCESAAEAYEDMWSVLEDDEMREEIDELASSRDLYKYGRTLHSQILTLLTVFRLTGDLRLLDEVAHITDQMREELKDDSRPVDDRQEKKRDGYLNWVFKYDNSDFHLDRDWHEMDEIMTHGIVAEYAYAFANNADLESPNGIDYEERAEFWLEYLTEHFEAKWRERLGVREGTFPFLFRPFVHVTMAWIKYHYYMSLLTGDSRYLAEAERLSELTMSEFTEVETDLGPAIVWKHGIERGDQEQLQATTYAGYTMGDILDLYFEGFQPWSDVRLPEGLANTLLAFIIDEGNEGFSRDIGGGEPRAGLEPSSSREKRRQRSSDYAMRSFALFSNWDQSDTIPRISQEAFEEVDADDRFVHIPAGIFMDAILDDGLPDEDCSALPPRLQG